jgi:bifunctional non-homologous end joining protein LigD
LGRRVQTEIVAAYLVFDLLVWRGEDLRARTWEERQTYLGGLELPDPLVRRVENVPGERGEDLYGRCRALGLEGVVGKQHRSPYRAGKSDRWRKVKVWRELSAVIGGFLETDSSPVASLLLGLYEGEELIYIGRVAAREKLPWCERPSPPFRQVPANLPGRARWIEPALAVWVRYLEWTPGMCLRAPVLLGPAEAGASGCRL